MNTAAETDSRFDCGAGILLAATVAVKIIGAIFKIPLSNLLGNEGFGRFSSAYDLFLPFYTLAMSGLPVAAARLLAAEQDAVVRRQKATDIFRWFTRCGWMLFGLFVVGTPWLYKNIALQYRLLFTAAIAPAIPLFFRMAAYRGVDQGNNRMAPTALSDVVEALGKLVFGYGFAAGTLALTKNLLLAAAATLLGITLGVAAADVLLRLLHPERPPKSKLPFDGKALARAAAPAAWTALVIGAWMGFADAFTVPRCLTENAAALYGLRSKAYTLYQMIPTLTTAIGVGLVPAVARAAAQKNDGAVAARLQSALKAAMLIAVPAGIGLCSMAGPIMRLLYGTDSMAAVGAGLLRIYGISAIFAGICVPLVHTVQALGCEKQAAAILTTAAAVKVILNFVLLPIFGIYGAAAATGCCFVLVTGGTVFVLARQGLLRGVAAWVWRPFAAAVGCAAVGFLPAKNAILTVLYIALAIVTDGVLIVALRLISLQKIGFLLKKAVKK